jgi:hypothetical protein
MVRSVLPTTLPLRPAIPNLRDPADADCGEGLLPLVEIIELKWLLAGHGVHIHVERLQRDPAYARQALTEAASHEPSALRAVAQRLLQRLGPAA